MAAIPSPTDLASAHLLTSPTLSAVSSYDMVPGHSRTSTASQSFRITSDDSDDEIVWSISEDSMSAKSSDCADAALSDDDFVVLNKPRPHGHYYTGTSTPVVGGHLRRPNSTIEGKLASISLDEPGDIVPNTPPTHLRHEVPKFDDEGAQGSEISDGDSEISRPWSAITQARSLATPEEKDAPRVKKSAPARKGARKGRKRKSAARSSAHAYPSPEPSPEKRSVAKVSSKRPVVSQASRKSKPRGGEPTRGAGLGRRPIVGDASDRQFVPDGTNSVGTPTLYEEASTFISSFLSNPDAKNDSICRLTLLQSLIIELGINISCLPTSLTAARAILKSQVFLNIRDYLAVRGQGPEAVQRLLYPSKSALIKDIKKKGNAAPVKWVKQHGLQVLLVGWMYR